MSAIVPFANRLVAQLATLQDRYVALLDKMEIRNTDPNRGSGGGVVFVGYASWGWKPNPDLVNDRTRLLADLDEVDQPVPVDPSGCAVRDSKARRSRRVAAQALVGAGRWRSLGPVAYRQSDREGDDHIR